MGVRFRKSIKICPGVKVNIGAKSTGVSIGGKYGGISYNTKSGVTARATAYGTGLSYREHLGGGSNSAECKSQKEPRSVNPIIYLVLTTLLGFLGVHRFYRGQLGIGILYLLTGGIVGIGWIIDVINAVRILLQSRVTEQGQSDQQTN